MASGIDGPGDGYDNLRDDDRDGDASNDFNESPEDVLSSPSMTTSPSNPAGELGSHYQGQYYMENETMKQPGASAQKPDDEGDSPKSSNNTDRHLSFADLMEHQNRSEVEPSADIRRMASYPTEGSGIPNSDTYNPSLHMDTSLNIEMEKVFDEDLSVEPLQLQMDFSNPGAASDSSNRPPEKFDDKDFSTHRRSIVHMYQPMSTHLSSTDMKAIQSVQAGNSSPVSSTKRRRHRSSSSSGSLSSSSATKSASREVKSKKKKSKKQRKRKLLTAKMRGQTLSIPEEDEEEDSEEESDDDKEDNEREDERRDEEDGGEKEEENEEEQDEDEDKEKESTQNNEKESLPGGENNEADLYEDRVVFVENETDEKSQNGAKVVFTVGSDDVPKPAAGIADNREHGDSLLPSSDLPHSFSSLHSTTCSSAGGSEGEENIKTVTDPNLSDKKKKKDKKQRHRHKKRHKGVGIQRRMSGLKLKEMEDRKSSRINMDEDGLEKADIDNIQSHRFDEHMGIRKHLLHRPVKKRKLRTQLEERKVHDRKPHEVFVELDELISGEWRETARWIKFEEDVEESQMWGKPRVASLSFHSLLELRKTLDKGAVMLDLEVNSLTDVANAVVNEMVSTGQIRGEDQGNVLRVLLSKHKHNVLETGLQYNLSKASFSSFFTTQSYASRMNVDDASAEVDGAKPLLNHDVEKGSDSLQRSDVSTTHVAFNSGPSAKDIKIMKKIPEGAEATAVLVGNVDYLEQPTMAFVRLAYGVDLDNVVALPIPVRFFFVLLGPSKPDYDYHEIGRSISTLMADQEFRIMAYAAESRGDLLLAINEFLDDSIVLPPGQLENPDLLKNISKYQTFLAQRDKKRKKRESDEKKDTPPPPPVEDPLKRTKRCFGGLVRDIKRRYPLYLSDITDAFNLQCLASIIFIYFAALSPAITFGGLLGEKTHGWMGVSEMILGCCIAGCTFGLFSGQPLLIVGSTGPLLVFEEAVYNFCVGSGLPFLAARAWIGVWICIICVIVIAFEGSFLVRYVTRFTQEIFSVLISLIFIYETFNKLAKTYQEHPLQATYPVPVNVSEVIAEYNCSVSELFANQSQANNNRTTDLVVLNQPNTALLSTLLMFGTFIIAYFLRQFKNSKFLRSSVRRTIGDFGVPIAIALMVLVDLLIKDTYTQKLNVPKGISPTDPSKRGWVINPFGPPDNPIPIWMIFAASIPAFLVFILIFMESHITEVIVSAEERKLKKGTGFHLNLLVLGVLNVVLSMFGMPWVCCAAVRSITHTNSLTVMSTTQAPGAKPKIEGVKEQRITVFVVNACLGLSILMQPVLKEIPLAVLFGIFLYMGVTSLTGVEFVDRLVMLFMPAKHYPDYSYVKVVRSLRIHLFTLIESVCLVVLWAIKSTAAQIAFPFALVLTVPLRFFVLPKIFSKKELGELDCSGSKPSVTSTNMDEYNDAQMPD